MELCAALICLLGGEAGGEVGVFLLSLLSQVLNVALASVPAKFWDESCGALQNLI